jgi:hypothetical protein
MRLTAALEKELKDAAPDAKIGAYIAKRILVELEELRALCETQKTQLNDCRRKLLISLDILNQIAVASDDPKEIKQILKNGILQKLKEVKNDSNVS